MEKEKVEGALELAAGEEVGGHRTVTAKREAGDPEHRDVGLPQLVKGGVPRRQRYEQPTDQAGYPVVAGVPAKPAVVGRVWFTHVLASLAETLRGRSPLLQLFGSAAGKLTEKSPVTYEVLPGSLP
ncbi:hypothetical protein GMSM_00500 [Geomonas sp. Red276]